VFELLLMEKAVVKSREGRLNGAARFAQVNAGSQKSGEDKRGVEATVSETGSKSRRRQAPRLKSNCQAWPMADIH
jgi:hypothetical protein